MNSDSLMDEKRVKLLIDDDSDSQFLEYVISPSNPQPKMLSLSDDS